MSTPVISVRGVSKRYCRSLKMGMLHAISDIASDTVGLRGNRGVLRKGEFWSLKDIDLEVRRGACMGLIGMNGAGKSTLLKLINGIVRPDEGEIRVVGRVGALIEVGAGFHPMLSGRENIYINGAILGMSKREIDRKFDDIIAFSELSSEVLDAPVKTYSSGMYVRLGFSVAVHCEPDVLLIDEVLAVGDSRFVGKCHQRIQQLLNSGVSCILVSHSLNMIETFCSDATLLNKGRVLEYGPVNAATTRYRQMILEGDSVSAQAAAKIERHGVAIVGIQVVNERNEPVDSLPSGEPCAYEVTLRTTAPVQKGIVTLSIQRHPDGLLPFSCRLEIGKDIPTLETGAYRFGLPMLPMPGTYKAWITISGEDKMDILDQAASRFLEITPSPHAPERIVGDTTQGACVLPPAFIEMNRLTAPASVSSSVAA